MNAHFLYRGRAQTAIECQANQPTSSNSSSARSISKQNVRRRVPANGAPCDLHPIGLLMLLLPMIILNSTFQSTEEMRMRGKITAEKRLLAKKEQKKNAAAHTRIHASV